MDEMFMDMDQNRDGEITLTEYLCKHTYKYVLPDVSKSKNFH